MPWVWRVIIGWEMAEESDQERTEPASPRRLEKAREEGQVPRSRELSTFAVLMAGGGVLWAMGNTLSTAMGELVRDGFSFDASLTADPADMLTRLSRQATDAILALSPVLLLLLAVALLTPMLLHGWLFSAKAIVPKFNRLNPLSGIKRMVSISGMVELGKAVAKVILLGAVAVWLFFANSEAIFSLSQESLPLAVEHLGHLVGKGFLLISGAMLVVVLIDVPFQIWNHHKELRMSREDLRQELKETDGDPMIKAQIRARQREVARRRMMAEIPNADVVVTNPTRYAVALKYSDGEMRAPRVVAKGTDLVAAKIREIAAEHKVPTLEAPPLARALYRHTELGDEIPSTLYAAVAEVLAYVFQLRHYRQAGGMAPEMPRELQVPRELDPLGAAQ